MRKSFLILAATLCTFLGTRGQTYLLDRPELYIGTSHGATASMVQFSPKVRQDILLGYNGGLTVCYMAEKGMGIQGEINFSQRGWKEKEGLHTRRLEYIEVPFMSHFALGEKVRFIVNLGPKAAILLKETTLVDLVADDDRSGQHEAVEHWFDYGVVLGIGLEVAAGRQLIQLEARANYSLSTLYERKVTFDYSNNMNLSLNLGWLVRVN